MTDQSKKYLSDILQAIELIEALLQTFQSSMIVNFLTPDLSLNQR